ncbi:3'(2'),5'-bisphosphate nucleotidase CysQ family protein [Psychromonas aquatilis]|uniref:Inositol monophosphatase family protein n=1 Tax=Psychromonas aquatilis TaxID=2005072 RepID=A0ABU9GT62_9GAMM
MQLTTTDLNILSQQALEAVQQAGEYIRGFDRGLLKTHFKAAGSSQSSQVVTQVDFACQEIILARLQSSVEQYDLAVLTEEGCSEEEAELHPRLSKGYFWCIDPLDGTLPFIEGSDGYAVSIALVNKTGVPVIGAVYHPLSDNSYFTLIDNHGERQAYKNAQLIASSAITRSAVSAIDDKDLVTKQPSKFILYCDRSFKSHLHYPSLIQKLTKLAETLGYDQFNVHAQYGAVVNALSVIETENKDAACYIKLPKTQAGGGSLWDFSATACLAHATDRWVSDIHGLPLDLNRQGSHYMNHKGVLYASDSVLAQHIVDLCDQLIRESL